MKKLALTAAMFAAVSLGAAHAQTPQPAPSTPPGATTTQPGTGAQAPTGAQPGAAMGQTNRQGRSVMNNDGYQPMAAADRTADNLEGADVYTRENEEIGDVSDLVLDANGQVTHLVVDVGGFLGMGTHSVALPLDEVDIRWNQDKDDARVFVSLSEDQLRALPEHKN
ncbi:MAG: PRC-barrel domain-containing protein [Pigmentiphaga sp.]|nr:PRC-barrel domain-containing protein [Pigmentiphaga sp.]